MSGDRDILAELSAAGVSIWLDDLSRDPVSDSGSLARLVEEMSWVVGVTTNPTIFQRPLLTPARTSTPTRSERLPRLRSWAPWKWVRALGSFLGRRPQVACDLLAPVAARPPTGWTAASRSRWTPDSRCRARLTLERGACCCGPWWIDPTCS